MTRSLVARSLIRRIPRAARLRRWRLNVVARTTGHQDFRQFLDRDGELWNKALARASSGGPKVLIATNIGGHFGLNAIDRLLAVSLTLRGARATSILCDSALPACQMCEINLVPNPATLATRGPPRDLCSYCYGPAARRLDELRLSTRRLSSVIAPQDLVEAQKTAAAVAASAIRAFTWNGLPIGEHAMAGALRYFARADLSAEPQGEPILRRFLLASLVTAIAYDRLFETLEPDVVVAHHGIYVPQGIVTALARQRGIRVVTWNPAYRRHCFIFSHDDTYHRTLMTESAESWLSPPLSPEQQTRIDDYLASRFHGGGDWIRFHKVPDPAGRADLGELGLDPEKPTAVALTNVFWDAQLHYPENAFGSQLDWLVTTIAWFAGRPDLQLVIRIHPAEISGSPPSRQRADDEIRRECGTLPPNVAIVPPESSLSTYRLAYKANVALIFATKMGVELSAVGLPVIVAGEAWSRNKGFTLDAASREDYLTLLSRMPFGRRLTGDSLAAAKAYAYHFFFRRMIPLDFVIPEPGPRRFTVAVDHLEDLLPGRSPGLDIICGGIATGSPFLADERSSVDRAFKAGQEKIK